MHSGGQLELRFPPAETNHPVDKPVALTQSGIDAELTLACAGLARDLGLKDLAGKLSVVWNQRMRSTAGRAFWPEGRIELNPKLIEFSSDEVRSTMLHELVHSVAYVRVGRKRI